MSTIVVVAPAGINTTSMFANRVRCGSCDLGETARHIAAAGIPMGMLYHEACVVLQETAQLLRSNYFYATDLDYAKDLKRAIAVLETCYLVRDKELAPPPLPTTTSPPGRYHTAFQAAALLERQIVVLNDPSCSGPVIDIFQIHPGWWLIGVRRSDRTIAWLDQTEYKFAKTS